jgi:hypothetical protein
MDTQQALLPNDSGNFVFKGRIFDWVVGGMPFAVILDSRAISARLLGIVEPFFTTCGNSSIWRWFWTGVANRTCASPESSSYGQDWTS